MKKERYTLTDIARELGVSCSTVSRALNNMEGVGEELRNKIVSFAEEVGYFPNAVARNSATGRMNVISLILGDIRNPFYADLVFHIQKDLSAHGYLLNIFSSEYNEAEEIKYIRLSERFNFSGLILLTACTEKISNELRHLKIPVVLVNRSLNMFRTDTVLLDNFKAGYIAAMHLIESGHSRIGYIMGPQTSVTSMQRYEGYCQAMKNYDLKIDPSLIFQGDLKMETGKKIADKLFTKRDTDISAMIISNDLTALGFIGHCTKKKIKIPEMLSVVSYDDIAFSSLDNIQLTTVSQHVAEMSHHATDLMLRRIRNENADFERIILDPTLVIRKTTLPYSETQRIHQNNKE